MNDSHGNTKPESFNIGRALEKGLDHHKAGRLAQAELHYQQILTSEPNNHDALHLLGVIAHQVGHHETAVNLIVKAIEVGPDHAEARNNLGNALVKLNKIDEAIVNYKQAILLRPEYANAHTNLGNAYRALNRLPDAIESYQSALTIDSNLAETLNFLGNAMKDNREPEKAVPYYLKAVELKPNFAEAHNNLGVVSNECGNLCDAVASFEAALAINPNYARAYNNLGTVLVKLSRNDEAIETYHKAIAKDPEFAEAYSNLGAELHRQADFDKAATCFHQALSIKPDFAEAHYNLGLAQKQLDQLDQAIVSYCEAVTLKPDFADAYNDLGIAYWERGKLEMALESYHSALSHRPDFADVYLNLGNAHRDLGQHDAALESYYKALDIRPDYAEAQIDLAIYYWLHDDQDALRLTLASTNPKLLLNSRDSYASFYALLTKLTDYKANHADAYGPPGSLPRLCAFGESHSLLPAHTHVDLFNSKNRVEPNFIVGCRAWHLANNQSNIYKALFEKMSDNLSRGEIAVVMFGEIDCRPNGGILSDQGETGDDLLEIIQELVRSYVSYVVRVFSQRGITPIFYGVPARIVRTGALSSDKETRAAHVIRLFNQALETETKNRGIDLLDIYGLTNDANDQSSGDFHIDSIHVFPSTFGHLVKRLS